jgi:hypothetical protein
MGKLSNISGREAVRALKGQVGLPAVKPEATWCLPKRVFGQISQFRSIPNSLLVRYGR